MVEMQRTFFFVEAWNLQDNRKKNQIMRIRYMLDHPREEGKKYIYKVLHQYDWIHVSYTVDTLVIYMVTWLVGLFAIIHLIIFDEAKSFRLDHFPTK